MQTDTKKRVGVIRGGMDGNYEASIRAGADIISHIFENLSDKYKVIDIFIDRDGVWHLGGIKIEISSLSNKVDLVWNTAHPSVSNIIKSLSIPQVDISSFSFLLKQNDEMLRTHLNELGLKMPKKVILPLYQPDFDGPLDKYVTIKAREILGKFSSPWIVRSFTPDLNMGIHIAKTFPELLRAIEDGVMHKKSILVEEFISGKNASVHSLSGFRGEDVYVFPPGDHLKEEKDKLIKIAKDLHKHLGVEHYLKSEFAVHPKRGIFITNIILMPDLKNDASLALACESVGVEIYHIVEHMLERAL